ncbi:asparagine synthase-related protein [Synechococcus sp. MIT S9508]|uniref:asparagine synthase-related protein n=1 Tax=Synechococcus sp. MIT S9508 TaxID=1801629 RepID=UPI0007BB013A|nr:asparagine synthase-related protein [Synechococcus sp. MIT S9508]KZR90550.1 hypothetical protein MITS9508_00551 [Synechococcus sp. MIT S9508]
MAAALQHRGADAAGVWAEPRAGMASLAWQLPISLKMPDGADKSALSQLLDCNVPRSLIDRPKAGFGLPIGSWLCGPLRFLAEDLLNPALIRRLVWLRPEPVQRLWQAHLRVLITPFP